MQRIEAQRQPVDVERYRGSFADERHVGRVIEGPCQVHVDGAAQPSIVYVELAERQPAAVAALRSIKFATTGRTAGMVTTSRTFGYAPKKTLRLLDTCSAAALARENPAAHREVARLAELVERHYREANPGMYAQHERIVEQVLPEWRLEGGVFTSGIINHNNKLPYHYDAGNFRDCWSNMLVFKRSCVGGDLVCPELDLCFRLRDHSLFMFDGQGILHGVSPFRIARRDGYRYSIVFYSLKQMWRCDAKADSVALAAQRRTERERAKLQ